MTSEIKHAQDELIEEFSLFDNWVDRYQYIIDLGKRLPAFPEEWRTDERKLHGCQSQVWFHIQTEGDRLSFQAISDSAIVSGLIAILMRVYSERQPQDILDSPPDFIHAIGLDEHLSPTRSNGLGAMIQEIRRGARAVL